MHANLVVIRKGVHEVKELVSHPGIDQWIYKSETVMLRSMTSMPHMPFASVLLDQHNAGQPSRVIYLLDKASL